MAFSDQASQEANALVSRLAASQSERSVKQLRAFRDALEAAAKTFEAALVATPPVDEDVRTLAHRLSAAAEAEIKASAERVQKEAKAAIEAARAQTDAARKQAETVSKQAEALSKQAEASRKELESVRKESDALQKDVQGARKQAEASHKEIDGLRTEITALRKEAEAASHAETGKRVALEDELQEVRDLLDATLAESADLTQKLQLETEERERLTEEHEKLVKELAVAQTQLQAAQTQRQSINTLLKTSNTRVQTLERANGDAEKAMRELQAKLDAALAAGSRAAADAARGPHPAAPGVDAEALRNQLLAFGSLFDSLLTAFQQLSGASTISDVLNGLVKQLATQFSRVAVFRLKGNRLEGEHQVGFDSRTDITNVAVPMSMDSLLARAAASGAAERLSGSELADSTRTPFKGDPTCALALPVVVNNETLAIVYADDSGQARNRRSGPAAESRTVFAELLRQYTVALLMRLTSELKTLAELREYATTLLNEVEHMFVADVDAGKKDADLRARLKDNVECARRIYAQRVQVEGPAAASLLEERLAALVEAQHGTTFGNELAAIAGRTQTPSKRRTAEAS